MSKRTCRTTKSLNEDEDDPEITSGDEAEREYERHADEPTDSEEVLEAKVAELVELMKTCHTKMIYTGAGISTAANIPDYRGPGGVYTLAKKGIAVTCHNIVCQAPTTSHLVIKELFRHQYISHIVSQNCDGMHLRSGIPQCGLSEIHGNMHIEVCSNCPDRQYIRKFDVTEDSGFRAHGTRRTCQCGAQLRDTIVHYGERGKARYPLNWEAAQELVPVADLIICIGSSLQVLKDYKFLWPAPGSNAKIVIINLQWTPKDADAALVIRGDCEKILTKLAAGLEIDIKHYCRDCDPILTARRNTRNGELLMKMTDCMCHIRPPRCGARSPKEEEDEDYCPGWWRVGVKEICKKCTRERRSNTKEDSGYDEQNRDPSSHTPSPPANAAAAPKRGRPKKRKSSADESGEPAQRGRRKASTQDDDEYEPQRHQQVRAAAAVASNRATRSSGAAEDHPLVGEFRKKRQDAGRRRGGTEAPETPSLAEEALAAPLPEEEPVEEAEVVEGEDVQVEVVEYEEEDVDVEECEEGGEAAEMMEGAPDVTLTELNTNVNQSNGHRPYKRHDPTTRRLDDDEDEFIDVVGDFDQEEIVYENNVPLPQASVSTAHYDDDEEEELIEEIVEDQEVHEMMYEEQPPEGALRGTNSASLSMSLSQLNGAPQDRLGHRSLAIDPYDFHEDSHHDMMGLPHRQRYDAHTASFVPAHQYRGRYSHDGAGPSASSYYDDHEPSPSRLLSPSYEPIGASAFSVPAPSHAVQQQLNFSKSSQSASTSATLPSSSTLPPKYQRGPRRKKAPDGNSVEAFLRMLNGSRPTEMATGIGAIYEAARQMVNPEDNESGFQTTLITAVRTQLGVAEPPPPPEKKTNKKYTKRTPKKNGLVEPAEATMADKALSLSGFNL